MSTNESVRADRLKKLDLIKSAGMDPYPTRVDRDMTIAQFLADFAVLENADRQNLTTIYILEHPS